MNMTNDELIEALESMLPEDRKFIEEYILYLKDWYANPATSRSGDQPLSGGEFAKVRGLSLSVPLE